MYENSSARPGLLLATVAVVQFMVSLDLSVVNVGLPQMAAGLGFSALGVTWVIHAYALTFGGLLLLGGKAADRYGRRRVLLLGLTLFGVASLLGGFAQEPGQLVAARAAQGVGAAALAPAALALLTSAFPSGKARIRAFGVWSAMNAAGGALGVLAGGLLTEYASWRWVMFVNVPMAAIALAMAWRGVPASSPGARTGRPDVHGARTGRPDVLGARTGRPDVPGARTGRPDVPGGTGRPDVPGARTGRPDVPGARTGRPDVLGAVLATAGMVTLVFGIVRTDRHPWTSAATLTTLAAALLLLAVFVLVERRTTREPLLRLGLLANRSVAGANAYNLLVGAAMASAFYFASLYLQRVLGTGPALTGLQFLPFALGVVVGAVLAIRLGYRFPARTLLITGGLLTAAGFAWFGLISADGTFLTDILGPSIVTSIGFGMCLGPVVSVATMGVAPSETGTASGLLNSSRQIGASLGLAALGTAAHDRTGSSVSPAALNDGYALGLTLGAALLFAAVVIAVVVLRRTETPAPTPQPAAEPVTSSH
ncbi:MFS transporter [Dactylosporangium sp. CS-047395]|uniref:MFS transporter n=1 Tax=Dactylosporangium sp. CS-047395 TaxID=3239936 RepID=UPI003D8FD49A